MFGAARQVPDQRLLARVAADHRPGRTGGHTGRQPGHLPTSASSDLKQGPPFPSGDGLADTGSAPTQHLWTRESGHEGRSPGPHAPSPALLLDGLPSQQRATRGRETEDREHSARVPGGADLKAALKREPEAGKGDASRGQTQAPGIRNQVEGRKVSAEALLRRLLCLISLSGNRMLEQKQQRPTVGILAGLKLNSTQHGRGGRLRAMWP